MFDKDAYLSRISAEAPGELTGEALDKLVRAHLLAVPFENLEIHDEHRAPSLEPDGLFDKVVVRRRGGYCFELNKAFYLLLKELGFACYPVGVRLVGKGDLPRPISHRATVVTIGDEKWFADVGYGGPGPRGALSLSNYEKQIIDGKGFQVEKNGDMFTIWRETPEKMVMMAVFRDEPFEELDFESLSGNMAWNPKSGFKQRRMLVRWLPDGDLTLRGNELIITKGSVSETKVLEDEEAIRRIIQDEFGLPIYDIIRQAEEQAANA